MVVEKIKISGLARPMNCAGSLHFDNLPQHPKSDAAEEGTAFAEVVERMLTYQAIPTHSRNNFPIDNDMKFHAKEIVENVRETADGEVWCEERVNWQTKSGIVLRGSYDISFLKGDTLYVDDCKYGWGIIEPEENWQLIGYAIGQVIKLGLSVKKITMRIHQPRPYHHDGTTREWTISYDELLGYIDAIENRMTQIAHGHDDLVTGKHCKSCPAAAHCPAFNKAYFRSVEEIHTFLQDEISDEELSFQLDLYDRIKDILKVRKDSLEQLAIDRMKNGAVIPNYSTKASYGNRAWKKGIDAEFIKMMTNTDVTKVEMLSPAQAEKAGVSKKFIGELTTRYLKGEKLERVDSSKVGDKIFGNPHK